MKHDMVIPGNEALNHLGVHNKLNPTYLKVRVSPRLQNKFKYWNSQSVWLAMSS
jgi:hypothetical protein